MSSKNENDRPYHKNGVFPIFQDGKLASIHIYDDTYKTHYNVLKGKSPEQIYKDISGIIGRTTLGNRYYLDQLKKILEDEEARKQQERFMGIKKDVAKTKEMLDKDKDWYYRV